MKRQGLNKKKVVIGLTGSFGSGKTTVARIFKAGGWRVIDADKIAHRLIRPGSKIYKKIVKVFGVGILFKDRSIDRNRLGQLAFKERRSVNKLNEIIHPEAKRIISRQLRSGNKPTILDAPLLIESGLNKLVDILVVVKLNRREQMKRLLKRTSLSKSGILKRIKFQSPLRDKLRLADFVIDNSGTLEKTREQVEVIRRKLWKN